MLKRILSLDLNSKKVDAKKQDDWWFHEEPLNTPDTMVKCVITKIRGYMKEPLFYLRTLVILSVLSIGLQTSRTVENTSEGSISGQNESLELQLRTSQGEELQVRVTGKNTTEVLQSLKMMLRNMGGGLLVERSFQSTDL
tara:strand:- start:639 stop:1058 length:420 start_codon:yes stop_codon:yes gene_type:complete